MSSTGYPYGLPESIRTIAPSGDSIDWFLLTKDQARFVWVGIDDPSLDTAQGLSATYGCPDHPVVSLGVSPPQFKVGDSDIVIEGSQDFTNLLGGNGSRSDLKYGAPVYLYTNLTYP